MSHLITQTHEKTAVITLNRPEKHNAFDENLIESLIDAYENAGQNSSVHAIVLNANGKHFCSGADLTWMKKMARFSFEENIADAKQLANLLTAIHQSPKPTIALVQGAAMGGAVGLIAASDFALAKPDAFYAFSEVNLGLIPAVISPYVLECIGTKQAKKYFLTGKRFDNQQALKMGLIDTEINPNEDLLEQGLVLASTFNKHAPETLAQCKSLINMVSQKPINDDLRHKTAEKIAEVRASELAQFKLEAFLTKSGTKEKQ